MRRTFTWRTEQPWFRHAYTLKLDSPRLQLVMNKTLALKAIYPGQLEQFIDFLQDLGEAG